jgi:transcriptional regulator with XRE-family HTH domain
VPETPEKKGGSRRAAAGRRSPKAVRADGIRKAVGDRVRRMRKASGKSQIELAAAAGIAANYLSDVERGKQAPTVSTLAHIADALDTDIATLVDLRDESSEGDLRTAIHARVSQLHREQLLIVLRFIETVRF